MPRTKLITNRDLLALCAYYLSHKFKCEEQSTKCKAVLNALLQVQKSYRTVVGGRLEGRGFVDIPLDGKPSLTEYRCISQSQSGNHGWISTLDLCPHTGVTQRLTSFLNASNHLCRHDPLTTRWFTF